MVTKRLIGTDLDQIPRNKDLGVNAYIDSDYVTFNNTYIKNAELTGVASGETYNSNTPVASPTFYCDFAKTKTVDSRITFLRDSIATYTDADGLIKTVQPFQPRFDHDPITGKCKGVLVEEERTNLLDRSTPSTYGSWNVARSVILENAAKAPDGTNTATAWYESGVEGSVYFYKGNWTFPSTGVYTLSVYAKYGNNQRLLVRIQSVVGAEVDYSTSFDLLNGTIYSESVAGSSSITPVGDGWYRCSVTGNVTSTPTSNYILFNLENDVGDPSAFIYIWGAQLEKGSFATSFIPTTNGPVTRKADQMYVSGPAFATIYNPNEGTLVGYAYAKNGPPVVSGTRTEQFLSLSDGTNLNRMLITRGLNNGVGFTFSGTPSNINYYNKDYTYNLYMKFAGGFNSTETNVAYNGVSLGSQGQGSYINLATINKLSIGSAYDSANGFWNSTIAYVAYYPKKLTETELQEITYL